MIDVRIGDARKLIHDLADKSIDCLVTSPPYWGLRDYKTEPIIFDGLPDCEHEWNKAKCTNADLRYRGKNSCVGNEKNPNVHEGDNNSDFCSLCGAWRGQLGLEPTPELYLRHLLDFFDDVRLKLKNEGNVFVNLGDTYAGSGNGIGKNASLYKTGGIAQKIKSIPAKSKCLIPERFAIGMVERGWICRNDLIWWKPNHMPESVTDRLTKAHEVIYHFVKQGKYYYNLDAIRIQHKGVGGKTTRKLTKIISFGKNSCFNENGNQYNPLGGNPGDVWSITTQPFGSTYVKTSDTIYKVSSDCPIHSLLLHPEILKILSYGEQQDCLLSHILDNNSYLYPVLSFSLLSKLPHDNLHSFQSTKGYHHHESAIGRIPENAHDNKKLTLCSGADGQESAFQSPCHTKRIQRYGASLVCNSDYSVLSDSQIATLHNKEIHKTLSLKVEHGSVFFEIPSHIADILQFPASSEKDRNIFVNNISERNHSYEISEQIHFHIINKCSCTYHITSIGNKPIDHFAVFPLELVRRPILAGCPPDGWVLDPFAGSGTVGEFCRHNDRNAILFELNPDYKKLIENRTMLNVPELSEWCSVKEDA